MRSGFSRLLLSVVGALILTLASGLYQRQSGEVVRFATECGSPAACFASRKAGGFPYAYVFDSPATSVVNQLGVEDDFRGLPFVTNVWVYWLLLSLSGFTLRNRFGAPASGQTG